jgi:hypothetical protein
MMMRFMLSSAVWHGARAPFGKKRREKLAYAVYILLRIVVDLPVAIEYN